MAIRDGGNEVRPILKVEKLSKWYQDLQAVKEVSFEVYPGEMVGLLGPNGAGKTTILRTITGVLRPTSGRVLVDGYDSVKDEIEVKRRVAYVPEAPNPYDLLTVWEHLEFIARACNCVDGFRERALELIERFQLTEKQYDLVGTLSKGMRQKLAISCAFVRNASLYLLDEPLMGLDPRGQKEVKLLIQETCQKGAAVLISTHILSTAEELCDRVVILSRGVIVAEGTLEEIKGRMGVGRDTTLEEVFLTLTEEARAYGSSSMAGTDTP